MKTEEFRKKDISELEKMVYHLRRKLSDARFKFSANQVKNVKEVSVMKKDIARILTIIKETKNHA